MDNIVESYKTQYANMATRSREDVEYWNKKKVRKKKDIRYSVDMKSFLSVTPLPLIPRWTAWSSMQDSVSRRCVT